MVNDVWILDKGTFIKELLRCIIEARSSSFLVIDYNTCIIKSILNKKNNKVNLILRNVIVIKGFHVNIIFKALLYKKGTWYNKFNKILKIRDKYENNILL
jgi:hypothetical protein